MTRTRNNCCINYVLYVFHTCFIHTCYLYIYVKYILYMLYIYVIYIWGCVKIRVWIGPRWSRRMDRSGSSAFWYGSGVWIGLWVQGMDRGFTFWLAAMYYIYTWCFFELIHWSAKVALDFTTSRGLGGPRRSEMRGGVLCGVKAPGGNSLGKNQSDRNH